MALFICNYKTEINKTALNIGSSLFKLVSHAVKATELFSKLQCYRLVYQFAIIANCYEQWLQYPWNTSIADTI